MATRRRSQIDSIKKVFAREMSQPSEDLVLFVARRIYGRQPAKAALDQLRGSIRIGLQEFVVGRERLSLEGRSLVENGVSRTDREPGSRREEAPDWPEFYLG